MHLLCRLRLGLLRVCMRTTVLLVVAAVVEVPRLGLEARVQVSVFPSRRRRRLRERCQRLRLEEGLERRVEEEPADLDR